MQVRLQYSILDHHGTACLVTLIIIVQRAAFARNRRLVNDGHERLGDFLAHHVRIDARALAIEVGLHAVTNRLVQQDATGTRCENDRHLTRRGAARIEQDHCAIHGFLDHRAQAFLRIPVEILPRGDVRIAGLDFVAFLCSDRQCHARHRPVVGYETTLQRCDHDALVLVGPVDGHLLDGRIQRFGLGFDELE